MLWDFLCILAAVAACSGAAIAGWPAGLPAFLVAAVLGLFFGFCSFLVMRAFGKRVLTRLALYNADLPPIKMVLSWLFFITAFLWVGLSAYVANMLAKLVVDSLF